MNVYINGMTFQGIDRISINTMEDEGWRVRLIWNSGGIRDVETLDITSLVVWND